MAEQGEQRHLKEKKLFGRFNSPFTPFVKGGKGEILKRCIDLPAWPMQPWLHWTHRGWKAAPTENKKRPYT
jgi:hypothetical protein